MFLVFKWRKFDMRGGWNDFDQAFADKQDAFNWLKRLSEDEWMGHVVERTSKTILIEIDPTTGMFPASA